jgi:hypothetical protein
MAVSHHDQQSITFGQAAARLSSGAYEPFDLLGRQVLARSAGPIRLARRRRFWMDSILVAATEEPVSKPSPPKVNWQPISALPLIASMIDGLLDEAEQQYENLESCRPQPHVLDDYTVGRVIKVYTEQAGDVGLYAEQLARWNRLNLTPSQRQEVARLSGQIPKVRERISAILALAEELKGGTIETVLGKSDLEVGLEFLLGKRKP